MGLLHFVGKALEKRKLLRGDPLSEWVFIPGLCPRPSQDGVRYNRAVSVGRRVYTEKPKFTECQEIIEFHHSVRRPP